VGVERQAARAGRPDRTFLLVLDPAHCTAPLEKKLRERKGWQVSSRRAQATPEMVVCQQGAVIACLLMAAGMNVQNARNVTDRAACGNIGEDSATCAVAVDSYNCHC
jgi:hypothetical protein